MMRLFSLLLFFSLFSSCERYYLSVVDKSANISDLASYHVDSPDPEKEKPREGQKLIISWFIPSSLVQAGPTLRLYLLFHNHKEMFIERPITRALDYWVYELINQEWRETGGLLTYRAEIACPNGEIYKEWRHQLYVRWIPLDAPQ
jgi:hypothetical protein